jgi:hypothetical protein
MLIWASALRVLKHVVRLPVLVRFVYQGAERVERDVQEEQHVATLARWACRVLAWSSGGNCLERGLVTYRYLSALNAQPVLVVGVSRENDRGVKGHAWVTVDDRPVGESAAAIEDYVHVIAFAADGNMCRSGG